MRRKLKELKPSVSQSNELIRKYVYTKNLSVNEHKILKCIISKLNSSESDFEESYTLYYDVLDLAGVTKKDRFSVVSEALEKLMSTFVELDEKQREMLGEQTKNIKGTRRLGLIKNDYQFSKNTRTIVFSIPSILKPFFLELQSNYTTYNLHNISNFSSAYDFSLYELLSSWKNYEENFFVTVDNLREIMGVTGSSYNSYGNFKNRILLKSIERINKHTNLNVKMIELKANNTKANSLKKERVAKIEFVIKDEDEKLDIDSLIGKKFTKDEKEYIILKLEDINNGYKVTLYSLSDSQQVEGIYSKSQVKERLIRLVS